ncbi:MAG: LysR family transcriptional regulator, partial [Alphaproteobacteria bacterium]|nr:LysR family transcriptional regulator [Alphaproteobacteria bacterium]
PASRAPYNAWMRDNVPAEQIVFRVSDGPSVTDAVRAGAGIGFAYVLDAARSPELKQVLPPRDAWSAPLWLVTHVDLHRTTKVQALLSVLKSAVKSGALTA